MDVDVTLFGTNGTRRLGGRFAPLLCLVATLLLFVAPAHATMQDISCEHLPQPHAQIFDKTKTGKLFLRADIGKSINAVSVESGNDDTPLRAEAASLLAIARPAPTPGFADVVETIPAGPLIAFAPTRAPPTA